MFYLNDEDAMWNKSEVIKSFAEDYVFKFDLDPQMSVSEDLRIRFKDDELEKEYIGYKTLEHSADAVNYVKENMSVDQAERLEWLKTKGQHPAEEIKQEDAVIEESDTESSEEDVDAGSVLASYRQELLFEKLGMVRDYALKSGNEKVIYAVERTIQEFKDLENKNED